MLRKGIFAIVVILLALSSSAQNEQEYLLVEGCIKIDRIGVSGADAMIYENNKLVSSVVSDSLGDIELKLDLNKQYDIVVTKKGYYQKKLTFNTTVPPANLKVFNYRFATYEY